MNISQEDLPGLRFGCYKPLLYGSCLFLLLKGILKGTILSRYQCMVACLSLYLERIGTATMVPKAAEIIPKNEK